MKRYLKIAVCVTGTALVMHIALGLAGVAPIGIIGTIIIGATMGVMFKLGEHFGEKE